jgi:hypothetical protein
MEEGYSGFSNLRQVLLHLASTLVSYIRAYIMYIVMTIVLLTGMILTTETYGAHKDMFLMTVNQNIDQIAKSIQSILGTKKDKGRHRITNSPSRKVRYKFKSKILYALASTYRRGTVPYDSDSDVIGIDNRCSGCISHVRSDFKNTLKPTDNVIRGFGGNDVMRVQEGTLYWTWDDDKGIPHEMVIPKSYYVPKGKMCLLSPQHWAQTQKGKDKCSGAGADTNGTEVILYWNNKANCRTVPINTEGDNVATFNMSNGYTKYLAYSAKAETDHSLYDLNPATIREIKAHSMLLTESNNIPSEATTYQTWPIPMDDNPFHLHMTNPQLTHGRLTHGDIRKTNPAVNLAEPEALAEAEKAEADIYFPDKSSKEAQIPQIHYDFGHLPFKKLREMARQGSIKKSLAKAETPLCSA